jgi:hypothetical protein
MIGKRYQKFFRMLPLTCGCEAPICQSLIGYHYRSLSVNFHVLHQEV